jgi:hypothetical protein
MRDLATGSSRRFRVRAAILLVGAIVGLGYSGVGVPCILAADDDALTQFGRLPASFNGRITTIESAAAAILRKISGRDVYFDDEGRRHSAAEWYLSEASRGEDSPAPKVLRIDNAELLALAKLEARTKSGPNQHRYSLEELLPSLEALREAQSKIDPAVPSELKTALDDVSRAYHALGSVRLSFREPDTTDIEQVKQAIAALEQLDSLVMPLVVPPNEGSNRWMPWARAVVEDFLANAIPDATRKPYPAVPLLREIFAARRAKDDNRFANGVAAYAAHLKARPPRAAALDFRLPAEWDEMGANFGNQPELFDDTVAEGTTAALFSGHGGTDSFRVNIYYFPAATAPIEHVLNDWRISSGYAPLEGEALQKTLTRSRIGSEDGVSIDLAYGPPEAARRLRATIVRREGDGFVVMCVGSRKAVDAEEARLTAFLESLKLGSPDDARSWFDLRSSPPRDYFGSSMLVAVARQGTKVRRFRFVGLDLLSDAKRAECLKSIEELSTDDSGGDGKRPAMKLPAGWTAADDGEGPGKEYQFGEGAERRYVTVTPLAEYAAGSELALFNHSRAQMGLPRWNADELAKQVRTVDFAGGEVRYVELIVEKKAGK